MLYNYSEHICNTWQNEFSSLNLCPHPGHHLHHHPDNGCTVIKCGRDGDGSVEREDRSDADDADADTD